MEIGTRGGSKNEEETANRQEGARRKIRGAHQALRGAYGGGKRNDDEGQGKNLRRTYAEVVKGMRAQPQNRARTAGENVRGGGRETKVRHYDRKTHIYIYIYIYGRPNVG